MYKFIELLIYRLKGQHFILDKNIPLNYILCLFVSKFFSLLYGMTIFSFKGKAIVHHTTKIKCRNKIRWDGIILIDRGCYLDALSSEGVVLGRNVSIGKYTTIECTGSLKELGKGLKVGKNVGLGTHGFFGCAGGVVIGDDTIFGNYVSLHSENHNHSDLDIPIRLQGVSRKGIKIGNNCWIGAKVTLLDGVSIGNGCIVAAGAVVRGIFPDDCVIGGIPAKILKHRSECPE